MKGSVVKQLIRLCAYPFLCLYFKVRPFDIQVQSLEETLSSLSEGRKSIVRFGDGEIKLIHGGNIYYQSYDGDLACRLSQIMELQSENFLVAMADVFNGLSRLVFSARVFWKFSLFLHRRNYRSLPKRVWANSFLSRPYIDYKDKDKKVFFTSLRSLWEGRDIVFVEGETTRNGVGNDLYANAKSVCRVICPASNAYAVYREIESYIEATVSKDNLILLSLGPAAKVISYDLYRMGFQAWDLGHIDSEYEWFLAKAKKKTQIRGKHTAESIDSDMGDCTDKQYLSQIVKRFI